MLVKILRTFSIILILFCIFIPILKIPVLRRPNLAVLVDNSKSMSVGDRQKQTQSAIQNIKIKHKIVTFDSASLSTDIAKALNVESVKIRGKNTAVLLLSDGINSADDNPVQTAASLGIPVYTLKIGEPVKDVYISTIECKKIIYEGEDLKIRAEIGAAGFNVVNGRDRSLQNPIKVSLKEDSRVVETQNIASSTVGTERALSVPSFADFTIRNPTAGLHHYAVEVSNIPDEVTLDNNVREFTVDVRSPRLNACWVSSTPTWNFKFIKNELVGDTLVSFDWFIKLAPSKWSTKNGITANPELKSGYDVMILESVGDADLPGILSRKIRGLLIIGTAFPELSPFLFTDKIIKAGSPLQVLENTVFPVPELPPLLEVYENHGLKPGARAIASLSEAKSASGRPVIAYWKIRGMEIIGIAANDPWRWNLYSGLKFWNRMVKYAAGQKPGLWVSVEPEYTAGEQIVFYAEYFNQISEIQTPNSEIEMEIKSDDTVFTVPFYPLGNRRYEAFIDYLPPGEYSYSVGTERALSDSVAGTFRVTSNLEMTNLTPDSVLLMGIAEASGGQYLHDISEFNGIEKTFRTRWKLRDFSPADMVFVLVLLVLLLSVEWFLLRR